MMMVYPVVGILYGQFDKSDNNEETGEKKLKTWEHTLLQIVEPQQVNIQQSKDSWWRGIMSYTIMRVKEVKWE